MSEIVDNKARVVHELQGLISIISNMPEQPVAFSLIVQYPEHTIAGHKFYQGADLIKMVGNLTALVHDLCRINNQAPLASADSTQNLHLPEPPPERPLASITPLKGDKNDTE